MRAPGDLRPALAILPDCKCTKVMCRNKSINNMVSPKLNALLANKSSEDEDKPMCPKEIKRIYAKNLEVVNGHSRHKARSGLAVSIYAGFIGTQRAVDRAFMCLRLDEYASHP